jgi:hypothetical protein
VLGGRQDIADALGIGPTSIHSHIKTKAELLRANRFRARPMSSSNCRYRGVFEDLLAQA